MTDGLLRGVEVRGDFSRGQLAAPYQPEDLTAMLVGERPEDGVGGIAVIGCLGRRATGPNASPGDQVAAAATPVGELFAQLFILHRLAPRGAA
jgi:hypothetical protein